MRLIINGEDVESREGETLSSLLDELSVDTGRVATMVNDEVVAGEQRVTTKLEEGDRVEVLVFAGGG